MAKERKLGKGLGSIFGEDIDNVLDEISRGEKEIKGERVGIKIADIRPNPYQPRKVFDEAALKELSDSIRERGVFQPVLVRKSLKGYELIAGERRMKASKMAGLKEIPAVVVDFNDADMMEVSLLENVQREDLSPIEEAEGYNQIIKKLGYTQAELAKKISKSREYISNILRLLKLPQRVQEMVNRNQISYGHARALLGLGDEDRITEVAERIVNEGLTVRDVEKLVKGKEEKPPVPKTRPNPYLVNIRRQMEEKLSTKVEVDKKKIVIHYSNTRDLNRILELLNCLDEE